MFNSLKHVRNRLPTRFLVQSFASGSNFKNFEDFFASAKCDVVNNAPIMVHTDKMLTSDANQASHLIVSKDVAVTSVSNTEADGKNAESEEHKETPIPPYGMDLQPTAKKHNLKISS